MSGNNKAAEGGEPLFVLATRLFVHYKFKTRNTFDASAALIDDEYARDVLGKIRVSRDATLLAMADAFERARFPMKGARRAPEAPARVPEPGDGQGLNLSLDTAD